MKALNRRITALEQEQPAHSERWHRITVDVGQAKDNAIAAYEAEHGPIGNDNLIVRGYVVPA